jgi:hypothetical protein
MGDPLRVRALRLEHMDEPSERLHKPKPKTVALVQQPVVVGPLEQVASICLDRIAERGQRFLVLVLLGPSYRVLEGGHVQPERRVAPPLKRARRDMEEPVRIRQGSAEKMEHVPEVGPGLRFGRVGPQEKRQVLSRLRRVTMQEQVGEKRLGASRAERLDRGAPQT